MEVLSLQFEREPQTIGVFLKVRKETIPKGCLFRQHGNHTMVFPLLRLSHHKSSLLKPLLPTPQSSKYRLLSMPPHSPQQPFLLQHTTQPPSPLTPFCAWPSALTYLTASFVPSTFPKTYSPPQTLSLLNRTHWPLRSYPPTNAAHGINSDPTTRPKSSLIFRGPFLHLPPLPLKSSHLLSGASSHI